MRIDSPISQYMSLNGAYLSELRRVLATGQDVAPRELRTMERTDCTLRISDPRARLVNATARRWSLHYALGELLWHLSASNDLAFISYYSKVWKRFTEDGRTISGSCYGRKIFGQHGAKQSRWESAKRLLRADPDTRRCVITLYDADELSNADIAKDVPCCNMLQFLIREGRLCLTIFMRSNDLMFGFVYDVFLFTMLQEIMASQLGVPLGWYQHAAGSLHVYDRDRTWAGTVISEPTQPICPMPAMRHVDHLPAVIEYEKAIRLADELDPSMKFDVDPYWEEMLVALMFHKLRRLRQHNDMIIAARRLDGTCFEPVVSVFA